MPIYEYRCEDCGFQKDHLQKMSDAPLAECPSCHSGRYVRQISAAGFQLKGTGWYATDFKCCGSDKNAKAESPAAPACGGGCACHPS
ncbi:MAG: zinc ribbon domain-containing protein [Azoarcus sp.]|jgi:putative FmdB family regulatory protein|nr:zinc ribbon domain-containing protein [Azoarcus sp.]